MIPQRQKAWEEYEHEPCPVCEQRGWCGHRVGDGDAVRCMRVTEPPPGWKVIKASSKGGTVFAPEGSVQTAAPRIHRPEGVPVAAPEIRDRVYRVALAALSLSVGHREGLKQRGLTDAEIERRGYRSLGKDRGRAVRAALDAGLQLDGVPGFYAENGHWKLGGAPGLLIPVRNEFDQIIALSIRADEPGEGGKYRWLSSRKKGGASPGAPVHVPAGIRDGDVIDVTEGALKADVATALGEPTIGIAGTSAWEPALPVLKALGVRVVRLVFDAGDSSRNGHVARSLDAFSRALVAAGFELEVKVWDESSGKGIDDVLLAGEQITTLRGEAARASIRETVRQAEAKPANGVSMHGSNGSNGKPRRFECTDVGNGQRLAAKYGQRIRHCHPWGKWLVYDGRRWKEDAEGAVQQFAKETARNILAEAHSEPDDTRRAMLAKWAIKSQSGGSITAMLRLAESEPGIPVLPGELDAAPWDLNCLNGTIDLRTGTLRPHRAADMLTKIAPVEFKPEATCPTWERVLFEAMAGREALVSFIQRAAGLSLVGQVVEHVLFFCHGGGANGKSVILNGMLDACGEFAMKASAEILLARGAGGHPTELADLFGKRMVVAQEVDEGRRMAEAMVKELTGGDRIRARRMREDFWEFAPSHTFWLAANHKPTVRGQDNGIWRRLRLVPFEVTIPAERQDRALPEKLRAEAPGILAWMVRGCLEWQRSGLGEPEEVKQATSNYRESMDTVAAFLEECTRPGMSCRAGQLYAAYRKWTEASGERPVSQTRFGEAMRERGIAKARSNGWWYLGIDLAGTAGTVGTEVGVNTT